MIRIIAIAALALSVSAADAATITSGVSGALSQTRGFERSGPYSSDWSAIPAGANPGWHQGRKPGVFEDAGLGQITFEVKTDAQGRARVAFQDVGDTGAFQGFAINGEAIELPSQRRNGAWFTAELDFGVGGLGWREVTARTTLRPGLARSRQDGFATCKVRR
jgi:hypothetical protein